MLNGEPLGIIHPSGISMEVLDAMWPRLWRRLYYFPLIWPSCGLSRRMRFSLTLKDIWAWYDAIPFIYIYIFFRVEEITTSHYWQLEDEKARCEAAAEVLNIADQSNKDLRNKLTEEEKARKSAELALEGT